MELSIPYIGFVVVVTMVLETKVKCFQFPILGSSKRDFEKKRYRDSFNSLYWVRKIYTKYFKMCLKGFQFPILGSTIFDIPQYERWSPTFNSLYWVHVFITNLIIVKHPSFQFPILGSRLFNTDI